MKNPVNIAKTGYNKILKIDELIWQLEQLTDAQKKLNAKIDEVNTRLSDHTSLLHQLEAKNNYLKDLVSVNHDIEKAPKAAGRMRLLQKANLKLLLVIKDICEKNNLEFYLNFGSLLGAIDRKSVV